MKNKFSFLVFGEFLLTFPFGNNTPPGFCHSITSFPTTGIRHHYNTKYLFVKWQKLFSSSPYRYEVEVNLRWALHHTSRWATVNLKCLRGGKPSFLSPLHDRNIYPYYGESKGGFASLKKSKGGEVDTLVNIVTCCVGKLRL